MYLLMGVLSAAIAVVVVLHLMIFRHNKYRWLNWVALFIVSVELVALIGVGLQLE